MKVIKGITLIATAIAAITAFVRFFERKSV